MTHLTITFCQVKSLYGVLRFTQACGFLGGQVDHNGLCAPKSGGGARFAP
jgi:hypothetical protein